MMVWSAVLFRNEISLFNDSFSPCLIYPHTKSWPSAHDSSGSAFSPPSYFWTRPASLNRVSKWAGAYLFYGDATRARYPHRLVRPIIRPAGRSSLSHGRSLGPDRRYHSCHWTNLGTVAVEGSPAVTSQVRLAGCIHGFLTCVSLDLRSGDQSWGAVLCRMRGPLAEESFCWGRSLVFSKEEDAAWSEQVDLPFLSQPKVPFVPFCVAGAEPLTDVTLMRLS